MRWTNIEEIEDMYKSMASRAKKAVSQAMTEKTEEAFTELKNCPHGMFGLIQRLKIDSREVKEKDFIFFVIFLHFDDFRHNIIFTYSRHCACDLEKIIF